MTCSRYAIGRHGFFILVIGAIALTGCDRSPQGKEAGFLRKGAALLQKKDYSRALLEFRNASAVMPGDAEPYYQIGITFLVGGSPGNAVAALRKATELNPHYHKAQVKLAELLAATQNQALLRDAAGRMQGVLAASPDDSDANDVLALAEWKLGQTAEATTRLEATLRTFPAHLQTSVELARVKLAQRDWAGAEGILRQAVNSAPQSSDAELALGQLYILAGDPVKAEAELRRAIQLNPKNGPALLALAGIESAGKRMDEAERTYRALSALPGTPFKSLHALFLFQTGRRDAAVAELEQLAREAPEDRETRNRLIAAYRATGKSRAAEALVASVLKRNPKDTDALLARAELSAAAGKVESAGQDLNQVLHFNPDSAQAHWLLAGVYKAKGMTMNVRQELNEALRIDPALLRARLALARTLTLANQPKEALDLLNAAPAGQRDALTLAIERNWALLWLDDSAGLRPALDRALAAARLPELLIQDSILRLRQRDYAGARADAEEAIGKNPQDVHAVRLLVQSYVEQQQPAKAQEKLEAIVAAYPHSAPLAGFLGQWYLTNRNEAAARKAFEASLAADPKYAPSALALAQMDARNKHFDAAVRCLLDIVAADPKNVPALLMLGGIAGEMHRDQEAIRRYRAVLDVDDSNVMALNNLAYTLASADPDEALKYAQHADELAPDDPIVEDTIGWVYYRKAMYTEALPYLQAAVSKAPTPRRQFHLGMSYLKSGARDLGEKALGAALRQDPGLTSSEQGWR